MVFGPLCAKVLTEEEVGLKKKIKQAVQEKSQRIKKMSAADHDEEARNHEKEKSLKKASKEEKLTVPKTQAPPPPASLENLKPIKLTTPPSTQPPQKKCKTATQKNLINAYLKILTKNMDGQKIYIQVCMIRMMKKKYRNILNQHVHTGLMNSSLYHGSRSPQVLSCRKT